jgi:ABC-type phosphate transport system substrate-binding protein
MRNRLRRIFVFAVVLAGFMFVVTPASADPSTTYVAVGSDVTQDVTNQFAADEFPGLIGSWNAINPVTGVAHEVITPRPGCSMTRPNGSGEGLNALRKSLDPGTTAVQLADPPEPGCVDIARSSNGPGANASVTGALQYVPFALDAVATVTGPATAGGGAVATNITHADDLSLGNATTPGTLIKLYRDCAPVVVDGVTYNPNIPAPAGSQEIHLYVPQAGSGTRTFWATTLGFSATTLPTCVHDKSVAGGVDVQQDDGTTYAQDPDGIGPFSVAQFVAQSNGHNDRRHGAAIHSLILAAGGTTPVPPTVTGSLNEHFPITREVYNIVQRSRIVNTGAGFDPTLAALLVGTSSQLCSDELTIIAAGFATLDDTPLGHACGATTNDLRAFDPATNPV